MPENDPLAPVAWVPEAPTHVVHPETSDGPVTYVWVSEGQPLAPTGVLWYADDNSAGGFIPLPGAEDAAERWKEHRFEYYDSPPTDPDSGDTVEPTPRDFFRGWYGAAGGSLQFGPVEHAPNSLALMALTPPTAAPGA